MDTQEQVPFFLLSIVCGVIGGLIYEIFTLLRWVFDCRKGKHERIAVVIDVTYWLILSVFCMLFAYIFHFPDYRWYMFAGFWVGFIICAIFLRIILAFFRKVCYTIGTQIMNRAKNVKKLLKREDLDIWHKKKWEKSLRRALLQRPSCLSSFLATWFISG